ncbi:uncharacterized protein FOMMEDRAFT_21886 [Fomitiporia mediterranea MF3/22]|uniref:uncharacterized protein n=1 Tax=Fomitiporia mediterranea (strain MF3/22) TaxID=694068 RepID=UPI000440791E|nr:uncharacterized protein FOMMEDRAFT_21886 [Fomitiporia mediterranea MF3/22]EJD01501.1 hypothetical protein FOMMEDRAFT_21886 [Fomitiporia mediterranea MF3/22]
MKRRGFQPDAATYSTMLHGMAQIESKEWPNNQENLERCHKLYNAFEKLVQTGEAQKTSARTTYFQVLGRSGNYQKMFDLFYKEDGTLPRDKALYTVLFNALLWRKETDKLGNLTLQEQNASDAKFLWRVLEKDVEGGMEIDAHLLRPFIKLMAAGRPVDQQFGLKVVRDYFGLAAPGEPTPTPRVTMNSNCLHAILELCNKAKKFRLCAYFFKEVMATKQIERNSKFSSDLTIGTRHVNEQLIALAQLASVGSTDEAAHAVDAVRFLKQTTALKAVKPPTRTNEWDEDTTLQPETVKLALAVCWRCGDWESATQIFSLATDLRAEDFLDDGPIAKESEKPFIPGSGRMVDIAAFSYLTRIALSTKDKAKMRQALRMMYIYGIGPGAFVTHYNFYKIELAKTILKLLDAAASSDQPGDEKKWKYLKQESREALSKRVMVERPESEEDGLGSQKYISKLQQAIDFELASRSSS